MKEKLEKVKYIFLIMVGSVSFFIYSMWLGAWEWVKRKFTK